MRNRVAHVDLGGQVEHHLGLRFGKHRSQRVSVPHIDFVQDCARGQGIGQI
jgi:hypothetical protein